MGITDSMQSAGNTPGIRLLSFNVIPASQEIQQDLFLEPDDFVYEIKRLRLFNDQPFMIETGYIPIKIAPNLSKQTVSSSIFNFLESQGKVVTKSFMSIKAAPSTSEDQELLRLAPNEPVGIMEGIFFLDDGMPFEFSNMRLHYQYLNYNTFVSLDEE